MINSSNSLVLMERAEVLLAEANTIQEVKEFKTLALTAADWAKRKGLGRQAERHCRSYALRAEIKIGEMLAATKKKRAKGGEHYHENPTRTTTEQVPPTKAFPGSTLFTLVIFGHEQPCLSRKRLCALLPELLAPWYRRHQSSHAPIFRERFAADVLIRRFGLDGNPPQTLEAIGVHYDLTRERIRQVEAKAIRLLRHSPKKALLLQ